ncbi:MAG: Hsp20/alpha crystallin family protein [Candidatus Hermodarchaeota archaeon]
MCNGTTVRSRAKYKHFPVPLMMASKFMHHCGDQIGRFGSTVPYRIQEEDDGYLILVPLPGRTKEDVSVSLIGNNVNITAKKPKLDEIKKPNGNIRGEFGPFSRSFFKFIEVNMDISLPTNANTDAIKSRIANGLLKIMVEKKPAKKIDIDTAEEKI